MLYSLLRINLYLSFLVLLYLTHEVLCMVVQRACILQYAFTVMYVHQMLITVTVDNRA